MFIILRKFLQIVVKLTQIMARTMVSVFTNSLIDIFNNLFEIPSTPVLVLFFKRSINFLVVASSIDSNFKTI